MPPEIRAMIESKQVEIEAAFSEEFYQRLLNDEFPPGVVRALAVDPQAATEIVSRLNLE